MASYTFDEFRRVLERAGFIKVPGRKHETWRKILPDGTILRCASAINTVEIYRVGSFTKCFAKPDLTKWLSASF